MQNAGFICTSMLRAPMLQCILHYRVVNCGQGSQSKSAGRCHREQRSLDALRWVLIPSARPGFRVWKKLVGASTLTYNSTRNFWRPIHRSDAVSIRNMNNDSNGNGLSQSTLMTRPRSSAPSSGWRIWAAISAAQRSQNGIASQSHQWLVAAL